NSNVDAATITATYSLAAPGGTFQSSDNGTYVIEVLANEVADSTGNFFLANSIATFHVNIHDTTPPIATPTPIANILDTGAEEQTFIVTYSDDVALDVSSMGNTHILVSGPRRFSQLATLVSIDNNT